MHDFTNQENAVNDLLRILDLEEVEKNLYRGMSPQVGWQRVFGGLVISQSLIAATRTVDEERVPHSLHGYFMRPGDPDVPIVYQVERPRDGRSFATRLVSAIQHGEAIFTLSCSFQRREEGLSHQFEMPDVPGPEDLPNEKDLLETEYAERVPDNVRRYWEKRRPIELRYVNLEHFMSSEKFPPKQYVWFRTTSALPAINRVHESILAYASDMTLLDTSLFAHGKSIFDRDLQPASLDHSLWFHRPVQVDQWLLYAMDSPSTANARGFSRGLIYTQEGELVASVAQEGLIRVRKDNWRGIEPSGP